MAGNTGVGLKQMQSKEGPQNPNKYWKREHRPKCPSCGKKIRGPNHEKGHNRASK